MAPIGPAYVDADACNLAMNITAELEEQQDEDTKVVIAIPPYAKTPKHQQQINAFFYTCFILLSYASLMLYFMLRQLCRRHIRAQFVRKYIQKNKDRGYHGPSKRSLRRMVRDPSRTEVDQKTLQSIAEFNNMAADVRRLKQDRAESFRATIKMQLCEHLERMGHIRLVTCEERAQQDLKDSKGKKDTALFVYKPVPTPNPSNNGTTQSRSRVVTFDNETPDSSDGEEPKQPPSTEAPLQPCPEAALLVDFEPNSSYEEAVGTINSGALMESKGDGVIRCHRNERSEVGVQTEKRGDSTCACRRFKRNATIEVDSFNSTLHQF